MGAAATATTSTVDPGIHTTSRPVGLRALVFILALVVSAGGLLAVWSPSYARLAQSNSAPAAVAAVAAPACDPNWQIVPSPNPGTGAGFNVLTAMAVVSPTDVWAVGYYSIDFSRPQTLIERWDGTQWSVVPSPNQGADTNELLSVAVVSSTDVWAVGDYSSESPPVQPLIERWNGIQWSIVPGPSQGTVSKLYSVAVLSPTDVWAVGYSGSGFITQTLVEHWDGTQWGLVFSPSPGSIENYLQSVAVVSPTDVWAVGYFASGPQIDTLVEHWDGTQWSVITSPDQGAYSVLSSVAVVSPTDVWAVGDYYIDPYSVSHRTLVERWDGTQWSIVPSPNQENTLNDYLYSVAAVSPTDVWAVGSYYISQSSPVFQTLVERWDGTQWSIVPSPNQDTDSDELYSVAEVSPTDVWAVGYYNYGLGSHTLVERYNPCPPTVTPTVTGTPPTNTPTNTSTATSTVVPAGTSTPIPPPAPPRPSPPLLLSLPYPSPRPPCLRPLPPCPRQGRLSLRPLPPCLPRAPRCLRHHARSPSQTCRLARRSTRTSSAWHAGG